MELSQVADILHALADPNRLQLLELLRTKERCVRDLVAETDLSQPLVSHHLGVLAATGLVSARRSGGFRLYSVASEGLALARRAVVDILDPALPELARPGGNPSCCQDGVA